MKLLAGIIGGFIVAIIGAMVFAISGASRLGTGVNYGVFVFIVLWIVSIVVAVKAQSVSKAWSRLLITSGLLSFLLPLSAMVFTGTQVAKTIEKGGQYVDAATAGAAIGGGLVSGFMGILGFFLGAVFLVIGFMVGRDKQIVYVQAAPINNNET
jgi:hypothetical protein